MTGPAITSAPDRLRGGGPAMLSLLVDGKPVDLLDDDSETVTVEIGEDTAYRCRRCGDDLAESFGGRWFGEQYGEDCPDGAPDLVEDASAGGHVPERVPLSWC